MLRRVDRGQVAIPGQGCICVAGSSTGRGGGVSVPRSSEKGELVTAPGGTGGTYRTAKTRWDN